MSKISGKLTIFFENPFWVGVFEKVIDKRLSVCKIVFGSEPKDYEIYDFVLKEYDNLKFSEAVRIKQKKKAENPKRLQREIHRSLKDRGISTKSQEILKSEREKNKIERKKNNKKQKEIEEKRKFQIKQHKKREKHKGR